MGGEEPPNSALILCAAVDHPQFERSVALSDLAQVFETIGKVRGHLEQRRVRTEADVRQSILNPVLSSLGWDVADPGTLRREHVVKSGRSRYQFDYALFNQAGGVVFVIEAKALGKLDDRARDQLLLYAMNTRTHLGLTTDGAGWFFYLPLGGGTSEERLVQNVDLRSTGVEVAGRVLHRYLERDRVLRGDALRVATKDRERFALRRIIESGWDDLRAGRNDRLFKAVASAAKAAAAGKSAKPPSGRALNDAVRAFIRNGFSFPSEIPEVDLEAPRRRPTASAAAVTGAGGAEPPPSRNVGWTFRGERRVEKNPTTMYVAIICRLYEDCGGVDFYERLKAELQGRTRTQIAPSRAGTGLQPKHFNYLRQIPGGWWLNTNLGTKDKIRNLRRACAVAGIVFGSELVVETDPPAVREQES